MSKSGRCWRSWAWRRLLDDGRLVNRIGGNQDHQLWVTSPHQTGLSEAQGGGARPVYTSGMGPALYAGGEFNLAGDLSASRIARWDGAGWMPLGSGVNNSVRVLVEYVDGEGPALYAGGDFEVAGDFQSAHLARYTNILLFGDGFESGDTTRWNAAVE